MYNKKGTVITYININGKLKYRSNSERNINDETQ